VFELYGSPSSEYYFITIGTKAWIKDNIEYFRANYEIKCCDKMMRLMYKQVASH
jgi:hypothetical protein